MLFACSMSVSFGSLRPEPACAGEKNHAAERIRFSISDERTFCVEFAEAEVSGLRALRQTGLSVVTKTDPQFGEFVCRIGNVGPEASDCPARDGSFWAYFQLDNNGVWRLASSGASATKVRCGGGEGWAWFEKGVGPPPTPSSFAAMCPGRNCGGQASPDPNEKTTSPSPTSAAGGRVRPRSSAQAGTSPQSTDVQSSPEQSLPADGGINPSTSTDAVSRKRTASNSVGSTRLLFIATTFIIAVAIASVYVNFRRQSSKK
jgi:hypothetical protein